jgi:formylglycine-generating enzyme required for sulfatase activity
LGSVLANRYRIESELGIGGMGRVYLAEDQKLGIRVAIKVPREVPSRDPGSVKRLTAEAKHSIQLAHPNVVDCEKPSHRVRISRSFELGRYPVTQAMWESVMASNPIYLKGKTRPVENVSWNDIQGFLKELNDRRDGYAYRLPTEAEWEYAARAGTTAPRYGDLDSIAWFNKNSGEETHPVGEKLPNKFGLYDMLGNVMEWCQDWYDKKYYKNSPVTDPMGPTDGKYRVVRGGTCYYSSS